MLNQINYFNEDRLFQGDESCIDAESEKKGGLVKMGLFVTIMNTVSMEQWERNHLK